MARAWRIQYEGAVYHVTSRGNNRQAIFLEDEDRELFLDLLGRASLRFGLEIFAFCFMTNHYHLFMRTPLGNLSKAMHWLNGTYTSKFNRGHGHVGHVFQGRYKSVLVADEAHYLHLSMYIHLNPVRAGLVQDPARYKWSSFPDYTRPRSRFNWLERDEILLNYGRGANRHRTYRRECMALAGTKPDFLEQLKGGVILGSREKIEELTKKYRPSGKVEAVTGYREISDAKIDIERELERVAAAFGVGVESLRKRRRNCPARLAAYYHLVENCGLGVTRTADEFRVSVSAVSRGIEKYKNTVLKNSKFDSILKALSQ